jgi:hypothetical protein
VPVDLPIKITWSKFMSITSVRTGLSNDADATVVLDTSECKKVSCTETSCVCEELASPWFQVESKLMPDLPAGTEPDHTEMSVKHRTFFTANELGYTEDESKLPTAPPNGAIPRYVPALKAKLRDDKQNCFYPSKYAPAGGGACAGVGVDRDANGKLKTSCCNKTALGTYSCPP